MKATFFSLVLFSSILFAATIDAQETTKNNLSKFDISGRIMIDYDNYDEVFNKGKNGEEFSLRRAWLSVDYKFNENWQAKVQVSYDEKNDKLEEKDLNVTYGGFKFADIKVGKFKQPFSLENTTSSKNNLSIERSMPTNSFAPNRSYGISLSSLKKKSTWSLGLFDATEEKDLFNNYSITGRATFLPLSNEDSLLHLGLSGSWRSGVNDTYRINQVLEVYSAKKVLESTTLLADQIYQYSVETAWQHRSLLLQGEYFGQEIKVKSNVAQQDASFGGYYLQASYLLTGEQHRYKKGRFVKLEPNSNYGAWEVVLRYSSIDAYDNGLGHEAQNTLLGVNYYINLNVRIMFNYIHTELEGVNAVTENSGDAFSARLQYVF